MNLPENVLLVTLLEEGPMDKLYKGDAERLRSSQRVSMLEIERVIEHTVEKLFVTRVLDVGCGTALFSEAFSLRKMVTTGIDINPAMVRAATDLVPGATFKCASAESLPFPDKSFDVVFLAHVLHESPSPLTVLQEARRVAKYRVAVLEWPYRTEETGPPVEHRLSAETVKRTAHKAGCIQFEKIELKYMVLYRMTPK